MYSLKNNKNLTLKTKIELERELSFPFRARTLNTYLPTLMVETIPTPNLLFDEIILLANEISK